MYVGSFSCPMMNCWRFCQRRKTLCEFSLTSRSVLRALPSCNSQKTSRSQAWSAVRKRQCLSQRPLSPLTPRWARLTSTLSNCIPVSVSVSVFVSVFVSVSVCLSDLKPTCTYTAKGREACHLCQLGWRHPGAVLCNDGHKSSS